MLAKPQTLISKKAMNQKQMEIIVYDCKNDQQTTFPCFEKPANIDEILQYFKLSF